MWYYSIYGKLHTQYAKLPGKNVQNLESTTRAPARRVSMPNGLDSRGSEHMVALSALGRVPPCAQHIMNQSRSALRRDAPQQEMSASASAHAEQTPNH